MLTRDAILNVSDKRVQKVAVPEWGGDVCVRVLSGAERDRFEYSLQPDKFGRKPGMESFRARFAALVLCDEQGERLFKDQDIPALAAKSAPALDRVVEAALTLNAMTGADVQALAGESNGDQSGASGSGSPATSG